MTNEDLQGLKDLAAMVRRYCARLVTKASFDKTSIGQVTAVNGDGSYTVAAFGGTYTMPYRETLGMGTVVRVKVPQNNWNDIYIESVV